MDGPAPSYDLFSIHNAGPQQGTATVPVPVRWVPEPLSDGLHSHTGTFINVAPPTPIVAPPKATDVEGVLGPILAVAIVWTMVVAIRLWIRLAHLRPAAQ